MQLYVHVANYGMGRPYKQFDVVVATYLQGMLVGAAAKFWWNIQHILGTTTVT